MRLLPVLRPPIPELTDAPSRSAAQPWPRNLRDLATRLRRGMRRHRRLLAAACAGLACALAINVLAPGPPASVAVLAVARDLPAGTGLQSADLRVIRLPPAAVPGGALRDPKLAVGRTTAGPMRQGEPLTDVRLEGGPLGRPAPGMVAAPVRLADAQAAALLRPGERVDVLAASTAGAGAGLGADVGTGATLVASDVTVVRVPSNPSAAGDLTAQGALVVLATTQAEAQLLAQAQVSARLFAVVVS